MRVTSLPFLNLILTTCIEDYARLISNTVINRVTACSCYLSKHGQRVRRDDRQVRDVSGLLDFGSSSNDAKFGAVHGSVGVVENSDNAVA